MPRSGDGTLIVVVAVVVIVVALCVFVLAVIAVDDDDDDDDDDDGDDVLTGPFSGKGLVLDHVTVWLWPAVKGKDTAHLALIAGHCGHGRH